MGALGGAGRRSAVRVLRSWRLRLLTVGLPAVLAGSFELLRARLQSLAALPEAVGVLITAGLALLGALVYLQTVYSLVSRLAADAESGRAEAEMSALRRGVADALHDSISQTLFFLHVRLKRAAARARALGDEALSAELAEAALATEDGYLEVRDAILRLGRAAQGGTALASENGLSPWVESALAGSGLGVRVDEAEGALAQLPPRSLAALRAIVLESVRNIRKHASARTVTVAVGRDAAGGYARIEDDGCGFSPGHGAGYGLQAARRRAEASAFDLRIESAPGCGTRVEVRWSESGRG